LTMAEVLSAVIAVRGSWEELFLSAVNIQDKEGEVDSLTEL